MSGNEKKPTVQEVVDALRFGPAVVCYTKCWPCQFGQHFDPPEPHTWGDEEDFDHAKATGQPEPGNCGCWCAKSLTERREEAYEAGRKDGRKQLRDQIQKLGDNGA